MSVFVLVVCVCVCTREAGVEKQYYEVHRADRCRYIYGLVCVCVSVRAREEKKNVESSIPSW